MTVNVSRNEELPWGKNFLALCQWSSEPDQLYSTWESVCTKLLAPCENKPCACRFQLLRISHPTKAGIVHVEVWIQHANLICLQNMRSFSGDCMSEMRKQHF